MALKTQPTAKIESRPLKPTGSGLVQIFTGEGKGKTSAALGNLVRALARGLRVYIVFFMKSNSSYEERYLLSKLPNITVSSFGEDKFIDPSNLKLEQIAQAGQALKAAREAIMSHDYDLAILDEVNQAAAWKLVAVEDLIQLIRDKPRNVEIILTGCQADPRLIGIADNVTEMVKVKEKML